MQKKNKLFKSQKGAISLYAILAMLFFLMFMLGAYTIVLRRNQAQINSITQLRSLYSVSDTELTSKYTSKFATTNEVIPISNATEFMLIGTGKSFEKNGKIYKCDVTKSYQLTNDIIINIDTDIAGNSNFVFNEYLLYGGKYTDGTTPNFDSAGHDILYYKDSAYWKCLVYQNVIQTTADTDADAGATFFADAVEAKDCSRAKTFSKLGELTDSYKISENFEFLLMYDANQSKNPTTNANFSKDRYNRWKQSVNPNEQSKTGSDNVIATSDTTVLNLAITTEKKNRFKGILNYRASKNTYLTGDLSTTNWWYAIATYKEYLGGIPADSFNETSVATQCLLFVRVK